MLWCLAHRPTLQRVNVLLRARDRYQDPTATERFETRLYLPSVVHTLLKVTLSVNCDVCCFLTVFAKKSQLRLHSVLRKYLIRSSSDDLSETDHVAITSSDSSF